VCVKAITIAGGEIGAQEAVLSFRAKAEQGQGVYLGCWMPPFSCRLLLPD